MKKIFVFLFVIAIGTGFSAESQTRKLNKVNLGPNVNSIYDDFAPVITPDGKTLYFCRQSSPENAGYSSNPDDQDIWVSRKVDGAWTPAENLRALNDENSNYVCGTSPDGSSILVGGFFRKDGKTSFLATYRKSADGKWSYEQVIIDDYYNLNNFVGYFLAPDNRTMILSVEREDGYGDLDLYVSFKTPEGIWTAPKNLGENVNSSGEDSTPFLAADGRTLYFSSDGRGGYGDQDVFVTKRIGDGWDDWTEPENLGPELNTEFRDYHYKVIASGEAALIVTDRNTLGGRDIFKVSIPQEFKPEPVVLVSGVTADEDSFDPVEAVIHYEILPGGDEAGSVRSNPKTGKYQIALPGGKKYGVRAEAEGYYPVSDYLDLSRLEKYKEIEKDLYLAKIARPKAIRISNLFFNYDSEEILPESYPELDRLAEFLKENPDYDIVVMGHTDAEGDEAYNLRLSKARAKSVYDYLAENGIDKSRMQYKGLGESQPIETNETEEGRAKNRRVEFTLKLRD